MYYLPPIKIMKISENVAKAKNFVKHLKSFINRKVAFVIKHRIVDEDLKILDLFLSISLT